jgi:PleD family two-component response regulator
VTASAADIDQEVLLKRADELMYEAKRAGKNRIVAGTVGPEERISRERFG